MIYLIICKNALCSMLASPEHLCTHTSPIQKSDIEHYTTDTGKSLPIAHNFNLPTTASMMFHFTESKKFTQNVTLSSYIVNPLGFANSNLSHHIDLMLIHNLPFPFLVPFTQVVTFPPINSYSHFPLCFDLHQHFCLLLVSPC